MEPKSQKAANGSVGALFLEPMFAWTREFASTRFNVGSPDIVEALQQMAQQHLAWTRAVYERIEAVSRDSTEMVQKTCTATADTVTALNTKIMEAGCMNSNAALDYAQKLLAVRSLSEFAEVSAAHGRKQLQIWAQQAIELSALSQTATRAAIEPIKNGTTKTIKAAA